MTLGQHDTLVSHHKRRSHLKVCARRRMGTTVQAMLLGPSLKTLAMVLKALLQQLGLNERVAGGLGSYCLLNLIIAHLMAQACSEHSDIGCCHK